MGFSAASPPILSIPAVLAHSVPITEDDLIPQLTPSDVNPLYPGPYNQHEQSRAELSAEAYSRTNLSESISDGSWNSASFDAALIETSVAESASPPTEENRKALFRSFISCVLAFLESWENSILRSRL